jgi:hypothetical protein
MNYQHNERTQSGDNNQDHMEKECFTLAYQAHWMQEFYCWAECQRHQGNTPTIKEFLHLYELDHKHEKFFTFWESSQTRKEIFNDETVQKAMEQMTIKENFNKRKLHAMQDEDYIPYSKVKTVARWELDPFIQIHLSKEDPSNYSVVVPTNHMSTFDWRLAADFVGDNNWTHTKYTACQAEALKYIFSAGRLQAVRYLFPSIGNTGFSYNSHGWQDHQIMKLQTNFTEVQDNTEGQYVYERKK